MNWYLRLHFDARTDLKLARLSDSQHRVWFNLLCYAGEQQQGGVIPGIDPELLAIECARGDVALLRETLTLLCRLHILTCHADDSYEFCAWDKRQYDKASDSREATADRKRRQRDREREQQTGAVPPETSQEVPSRLVGMPMSRDVTPGHAMSRDVTPIVEQNRSEQIKEEHSNNSNRASADREYAPDLRSGVTLAEDTPPVNAAAVVADSKASPDPLEVYKAPIGQYDHRTRLRQYGYTLPVIAAAEAVMAHNPPKRKVSDLCQYLRPICEQVLAEQREATACASGQGRDSPPKSAESIEREKRRAEAEEKARQERLAKFDAKYLTGAVGGVQ